MGWDSFVSIVAQFQVFGHIIVQVVAQRIFEQRRVLSERQKGVRVVPESYHLDCHQMFLFGGVV